MSLNSTEWDMLKTHLNRIEAKQDKTDINISELNIKVHDVLKTCAIVMPEEQIRSIANEEIKKSGPFNLGLSKKQITIIASGVVTIITFIINVIKT